MLRVYGFKKIENNSINRKKNLFNNYINFQKSVTLRIMITFPNKNNLTF